MPKYLGVAHTGAIGSSDLEAIPNPAKNGGLHVTLNCEEFTSHCPVTGQPDFAKLVITYTPDEWIVETKSIKLWLWSFRNEKEFNEALVVRIAEEFAQAIKPKAVSVQGHFYPRGGISVHPRAEIVR